MFDEMMAYTFANLQSLVRNDHNAIGSNDLPA